MLKLPLFKPAAFKSSTRLPAAAPEISVNGNQNGSGKGHAPRPEVARPRRRRVSKKMWWLGVLGALVLFVLWRRTRSGEVVNPTVKTAVATLGDVSQTISATGTLQPFTTVDVKSTAGGTVLKMAVEEGTRVRRGQLICLIDPRDTTATYRQAQADVASARAALVQAQQNAQLQNATIGPQIEQSAEAVQAARAKLQQSQQNLRLESSTQGPAIEQSTQAVQTARARLAQAQTALALQRRTAETAVAQARSGITSAQAKLNQARAQSSTQPALTRSAINQAQASVAASQANVRSAQEALQLLQSATQPQERASAQATVEQANSDLQTAQTSLTRQEALLARGFVAQNVVDAARNAVVTARSALSTAQSRLDTLQAQQTSQTRDAQARIEQAQGTLGQSRAALATARTNSVQDSLKQQDVTAARAALQQAQATLEDAVANRSQIAVKQGDVVAAQSALRQSQAALSSTRANSQQVGIKAQDVAASQAALRQAEAALRTTQAGSITNGVRAQDVAKARAALVRSQVAAQNSLTNLQQTRVVAPRDGVVLTKYVDEGSIIQSGQSGASGGTSIVQLANVARVYVDAQVDESDIAQIQPGQKVKITLDAYPNAPKSGTVRKVYPSAAVTSNVTYVHVQVEVDARDVNSTLRPNLNATCDFLVADRKNVLTVPTEAVKDNDDGTSTVTKIADKTKPLWVKRNQVEQKVGVGVRGDEAIEITSGLKKGDTVITQIIQPQTDDAASSTANGTRSLLGGPGSGRNGRSGGSSGSGGASRRSGSGGSSSGSSAH